MTSPVPNAHSTCEWVDEPYSRRLWAQLVKRATLAARAAGCLLTARKHAWQAFQSGRGRSWGLVFLLPGPYLGWLDLALHVYRRDGKLITRQVLLRISEHAGQRLFERLRTNAVEDLYTTLVLGLLRLPQHEIEGDTMRLPLGTQPQICLPWGTLYGVVDDGIWTAKTFIPERARNQSGEIPS